MLKHIKNLLKHKLIIIIAILITISIAIISLIKLGKAPIQINHLDKLEHAFAYFVLSLVWLLALRTTKINKYIIVFCCFFYGIIIETLQVTTTSYRSGEILDILANTTGILIAFIVYNSFFKKNKAI
ncbi:VanZ family protein [Tenacibaculum sp. 1_MG-2023]|uniref:VanZ family protein n=1 Tax=unclassified Tenacibaculum TaxID=2635139 RepID=UPI0026E3CAC5|nr:MULTISPECIES: VanZ family protein [unclassified Tenacibaculum]MDO6674161.1 VanZ family protein [Tenacibaculum sp. 1_MG-2023]